MMLLHSHCLWHMKKVALSRLVEVRFFANKYSEAAIALSNSFWRNSCLTSCRPLAVIVAKQHLCAQARNLFSNWLQYQPYKEHTVPQLAELLPLDFLRGILHSRIPSRHRRVHVTCHMIAESAQPRNRSKCTRPSLAFMGGVWAWDYLVSSCTNPVSLKLLYYLVNSSIIRLFSFSSLFCSLHRALTVQ